MNQIPFIQIINEVISHLEYQLYSGTLLYRFENSIKLPKEILFEGNYYHWIDEVGINPETGKLEYTCSTIDSEHIGNIPVNTQSPELLQTVLAQIKFETHNQ